MHTHHGKKTTFHYNSDLSGEVLIVQGVGSNIQRMEISGDDLHDFFLAWFQLRLIAKLEDLDLGKWLGR